MSKKGVGVGDVVMVRLARLPGMPEEDPTNDEMAQIRAAHEGDTAARDEILKARKKTDPAMREAASIQLDEEFWLYPRRRQATVNYVDRTGGGTETRPSGAPGPLKPTSTHSINVDVRTPGSTVLQPAVGHYPKWAQQTFRLTSVQFYDEEPEDAQDQHVAYPVPEPEDEEK